MDNNAQATQVQSNDPTGQAGTTPPATFDRVPDNHPLAVKHKEILEDLRKAKDRLAAIEAKEEEQRKKKLEEEGNYRALIDEKDKLIAELAPFAERAKQYDAAAQTELETVLKELPEVNQKLINGFTGTVTEKLDMAKTIAATLKNVPPSSSPASGRPAGGHAPEIDVSDFMKMGSRERIAKLLDLKQKDRAMYDKVMKLMS